MRSQTRGARTAAGGAACGRLRCAHVPSILGPHACARSLDVPGPRATTRPVPRLDSLLRTSHSATAARRLTPPPRYKRTSRSRVAQGRVACPVLASRTSFLLTARPSLSGHTVADHTRPRARHRTALQATPRTVARTAADRTAPTCRNTCALHSAGTRVPPPREGTSTQHAVRDVRSYASLKTLHPTHTRDQTGAYHVTHRAGHASRGRQWPVGSDFERL